MTRLYRAWKNCTVVLALFFLGYSYMRLENNFFLKRILGIFSLMFTTELYYKELINNRFYKRQIFVSTGIVSLVLIFLNSKYIFILNEKLKEDIISMGKILHTDVFLLKKVNIYFFSIHINLSMIYTYSVLFFSLYFILLLIYNSIFFKNKKNRRKKKIKEENLISFREKELSHIDTLIDDDQIQTILIDSKIGTGKTKIVEELIERNEKLCVIYLKLPLIENIEELRKTIFLEIKNIFKVNGIDDGYLNNFLGNISIFKIGTLEINIDKKNNNWENINQLKKDLDRLENKDKKILIILDDIEREKDINKIEKSISFLGELSEYFRLTKTTILFLADYNKIIEETKKLYGEKDNIEIKELYSKYFKYILKLQPFNMNNILNEDLIMLIRFYASEEIVKKISIKGKFINLIKKEKQKEKEKKEEEKYILFVSKVLNIGMKSNESMKDKNLEFNNNIRSFEKFLKQIKLLRKFTDYEKTVPIVIGGIIFIESFFKEKNKANEEEFIKTFYTLMVKNSSLINPYLLVENEVKKIVKYYEESPLKDIDFIIEIEYIQKVIEGEITINNKRIEIYDYIKSNFIIESIGNNPLKLNNLLENGCIIYKDYIIQILKKLEGIELLSSKSKRIIKEIILKEIDSPESEDFQYDENNFDDKPLSREEYEKLLIESEKEVSLFIKENKILDEKELEYFTKLQMRERFQYIEYHDLELDEYYRNE